MIGNGLALDITAGKIIIKSIQNRVSGSRSRTSKSTQTSDTQGSVNPGYRGVLHSSRTSAVVIMAVDNEYDASSL